MSVKIYDGYRIRGSLSRAVRIVERFRAQSREAAEILARRRLAFDAVRLFDARLFAEGGEDGEKLSTPLWSAIKSTWDRQHEVERSKQRDPEVDYSCDVVLLPRRRQVLALLFTEQDALVDLWKAQPFVEDYGYWDNTDRPDLANEMM